MKKWYLSVLIICLLVCVVSFAACAGISRTSQLETPVVSGSGFYARWDAVEGAGSYSVRVTADDSASQLVQATVTETSYSLSEFALTDGERTVYVYVTALPSSSDKNSKSEEGKCKITIPRVTDKEMLQYAQSVAPSSAVMSADIQSPDYTYYPATDMDLTLSFGKNVSSVKPLGNYDLSGKFSSACSVSGGTVSIAKSYMRQFDVGAVIQLEVVFSDGTSATHSVFVVDTVVKLTDPRTSSSSFSESENIIYRGESYIVYSELEDRNIEFTFFNQVTVNAVCVDGNKISFSKSKSPYKQVVNASALKGLSQGVHYITIYTDNGAVTVPLVYLPEYSCAPSDVRVDVDGYPNVVIRWEANLMPAYYTVTINGETYSSNDYPELFTVNSFDATNKINIADSVQDTVTVTAYLPEEYESKSYESTITSGDYSSFIPYLESTFTYLGSEQNFYITSDEEWNTFVAYTALYYDDLLSTGKVYTESSDFRYTYPYKQVSFAMGYGDWSASDIVGINKNKGKYAEGANMFREVVAYNVTCRETSQNIFDLTLLITSYKEPSKNAGDLSAFYQVKNETPLAVTAQYAHYSSQGNASGTFAIDNVTDTAEVSTSMQLYFAMEQGLRPVPVAGSSAERIYSRAREVMARITDSGMSDYEVVHAIYDYLTTEIMYDNAVAEYSATRTTNQDLYNDVYNYNCFYPEGVFDDGVAVCNGLSQAFVIMCAIEGIESVKISGEVPGGAHAWNKVCIDGMWYIVDTTWGRATYQSAYNVGEHDWLLVGEAAASDHKQDEGVYGSDIYAGGVSFDPYANMFWLDESGEMQDHKAATFEEFNAILAYYGSRYSSRGTYLISVSITIANNYFSASFMNNPGVTLPEGMTISVIADTMDRQAELVLTRG